MVHKNNKPLRGTPLKAKKIAGRRSSTQSKRTFLTSLTQTKQQIKQAISQSVDSPSTSSTSSTTTHNKKQRSFFNSSIPSMNDILQAATGNIIDEMSEPTTKRIKKQRRRRQIELNHILNSCHSMSDLFEHFHQFTLDTNSDNLTSDSSDTPKTRRNRRLRFSTKYTSQFDQTSDGSTTTNAKINNPTLLNQSGEDIQLKRNDIMNDDGQFMLESDESSSQSSSSSSQSSFTKIKSNRSKKYVKRIKNGEGAGVAESGSAFAGLSGFAALAASALSLSSSLSSLNTLFSAFFGEGGSAEDQVVFEPAVANAVNGVDEELDDG
jgi:hypothetical protein